MNTRRITVFGAGYVGLVAAACLSSSGHRVTALDVDAKRLTLLREGRAPFQEPGLDALIAEGLSSGRLDFQSANRFEEYGEFVLIAVGTPSTETGSPDLRQVNQVVEQVLRDCDEGTLVVMKSTVPPGTGQALARRLGLHGIQYVSNPEFLREGSAVHDWYHTDRMVLGGDCSACSRVAEIYEDINAPILMCDVGAAELIKYASNAFLALKISFANEIAGLCDKLDTDVTRVMQGVGMDSRIGPAFLQAGIGYGGSCFPKDTRALDYLYSINGHYSQLMKAVIDVNALQRRRPVIALRDAVGELEGRRIAVLGLSFKPETDDTRESPAADIVGMLLVEGAVVTAFDPAGVLEIESAHYSQAVLIEDAVRDAHAVVIATEWRQIAEADWGVLVGSMSDPKVVFDGRNCLTPDTIRSAGGVYIGVGRR